jgi:hypothetical protein
VLIEGDSTQVLNLRALLQLQRLNQYWNQQIQTIGNSNNNLFNNHKNLEFATTHFWELLDFPHIYPCPMKVNSDLLLTFPRFNRETILKYLRSPTFQTKITGNITYWFKMMKICAWVLGDIHLCQDLVPFQPSQEQLQDLRQVRFWRRIRSYGLWYMRPGMPLIIKPEVIEFMLSLRHPTPAETRHLFYFGHPYCLPVCFQCTCFFFSPCGLAHCSS